MRADKDWQRIKDRQRIKNRQDKAQLVDCVGKCPVNRKRQYASEDMANKARKQIRKRLGSKMEAYLCKYCKFWHIGHSVKKVV